MNTMQISRVPRPKSAAIRTYNRLSHVYDLLAGSSENRFILLGLDMLAIDSDEPILEIGSGTGKAILELCHRSGNPGSIHALDISPGMLRKARVRLKNAGKQDQVSLLQGDGIKLPYKNESFSAVFISFTLELFDTPEIPLVLAECQRVLKPGGRIGVVSMLKTGTPGWTVRLYEWFHSRFPAYVDCRPINAQEMIKVAKFSIEKRHSYSMWGLPVEHMVACKV